MKRSVRSQMFNHPKVRIFLIVCFLIFVFGACVEEKDTLIEKPSIVLISPVPCDTLFFGEEFVFRCQVSDNTGLGQISMDIHHNFGHHNHGAHESCAMDPPKDAVHPWDENWIFMLDAGKKEMVFDSLLMVPATNVEQSSYDAGDYHFHIFITDNEGYQNFTTMDVKIRYRSTGN